MKNIDVVILMEIAQQMEFDIFKTPLEERRNRIVEGLMSDNNSDLIELENEDYKNQLKVLDTLINKKDLKLAKKQLFDLSTSPRETLCDLFAIIILGEEDFD